jgi:hypothetical protein
MLADQVITSVTQHCEVTAPNRLPISRSVMPEANAVSTAFCSG